MKGIEGEFQESGLSTMKFRVFSVYLPKYLNTRKINPLSQFKYTMEVVV